MAGLESVSQVKISSACYFEVHQESPPFPFGSALLHPDWWKKWIQNQSWNLLSMGPLQGVDLQTWECLVSGQKCTPSFIACLPLSYIVIPLRHKDLKYMKMRIPAESSHISRLTHSKRKHKATSSPVPNAFLPGLDFSLEEHWLLHLCSWGGATFLKPH